MSLSCEDVPTSKATLFTGRVNVVQPRRKNAILFNYCVFFFNSKLIVEVKKERPRFVSLLRYRDIENCERPYTIKSAHEQELVAQIA